MLAILEKRLGLPLSSQDVFVSLAGGLRVYEPGADLGICLGIFSSLKEKVLDPGTVFVGEVGLSGELRSVSHLEVRLKEAAKLGFSRFVCPQVDLEEEIRPKGLEITFCDRLAQAVACAVSEKKAGA